MSETPADIGPEWRAKARAAAHEAMRDDWSYQVAPACLIALLDERDRIAEELAAARFAPLGDNHHNAEACPYCSPKRLALEEELRKARAECEAARRQLPLTADGVAFGFGVNLWTLKSFEGRDGFPAAGYVVGCGALSIMRDDQQDDEGTRFMIGCRDEVGDEFDRINDQLWSTEAAARAANTPAAPSMCVECDANPADSPSPLCTGCAAYREHTRCP